MLVSNLNAMEKFVSENKNLRWEGWNVIHLSKSNSAMYKPSGAFIDGQWYVKTIYAPDRNGWKINKKHLES